MKYFLLQTRNQSLAETIELICSSLRLDVRITRGELVHFEFNELEWILYNARLKEMSNLEFQIALGE